MKKILNIIVAMYFPFALFSQQVGSTDQLAFSKKSLHTIKNGKQAYNALIRNAEKELNNAIVPVTEKTIIAISGDKHDYISMGPYWWPDESKPNKLPYIRKDGQRNPEIQKLDRYKLDGFTKNVKILSCAYYFTRDEKYAQKAVESLKIWFLNPTTKMNPNLNYGQIVPGRYESKGRAEGLIDTYNLVNVVDCIEILYSSKAMKTKDYANLKQWFAEFLDWMLTSEIGKSEYSAKNNHGLAYDVQVVRYALFAERYNIADKFINSFAENRLFEQIHPDGSQPLELARTKALFYSIFNIDHAMDMCDLAKTRGIDIFSKVSEDGRSISKAMAFIQMYLGKTKEEFPYKQISEWGENQDYLCWILRRSMFFLPNPEFEKLFDVYCKTKETDIKWLFYARM